MTYSKRLLFILLILALKLSADPILSSWFTKYSGQYARIYETAADESALNSVTTWDTRIMALVKRYLLTLAFTRLPILSLMFTYVRVA